MEARQLVWRYLETFGWGSDADLELAICRRWHKSPSSVRAARKALVRQGRIESAGKRKRTEYGGWAEVWRPKRD